jgi:tol-pal system protein YbgF
MFRKTAGVCLLVLLPLWSAGAADKEQKVYELIYQDVQTLKKQVLDLSSQLQRNTEDLASIKEELRSLGDLVRRSQADQAVLREDIKSVPQQYQALASKIERLTLDLARITELLAAAPAGPVVPAGTEAKPGEKPKPEAAAPPAKAPDPKPIPAAFPSGVAAQDVYNMAYNDYLKGNFDLAIEGFKMYQTNFPDSPLADNALYWIGECAYSQRKFENAVQVFNELILTYPQGDKVAAAYLKKGMSFAELGRKDEAVAAYKLLITKFPFEEETRIAQQKIKEASEK